VKQNKKYPWAAIDVVINIRKQIRAQVKNARDKGICITTNEPLEKGKLLTIEISLPGMDTLKIKGKVMWSLEIGSHFFETGIDFSAIPKFRHDLYMRSLN
jgi:hypothetical protein